MTKTHLHGGVVTYPVQFDFTHFREEQNKYDCKSLSCLQNGVIKSSKLIIIVNYFWLTGEDAHMSSKL